MLTLDSLAFPIELLRLLRHRMTIANGELRYRDRVEDPDVTMIVDTATGEAFDSENAVRLTLEARLKDSPFTLELTGGPIQRTRDPGRRFDRRYRRRNRNRILPRSALVASPSTEKAGQDADREGAQD